MRRTFDMAGEADLLFAALEEGNETAFFGATIFASTVPQYHRLNVLSAKINAGSTVLHFAVERSRIREIEFMLQKLDPADILVLLRTQDHAGDCPLHVASHNLDIFSHMWSVIPDDSKLKCALISSGSDENLLHFTVEHRYTDVIRLILQGIRSHDTLKLMKQKNSEGHTALHMAASKNKTDVMFTLFDAIPTDQFIFISRETQTWRCYFLSQKSDQEETILDMAIDSGSPNVVCRLLRAVDENEQNYLLRELKLFWRIADCQKLDLLRAVSQLLGQKRWSELMMISYGFAVFMHAVQYERMEVIRCLLEPLAVENQRKLLVKLNIDNDFPLNLATTAVLRHIIAVVKGSAVDRDVILSFISEVSQGSEQYILYGQPRALLLYDTHARPGADQEVDAIRNALVAVNFTDLVRGPLDSEELFNQIRRALDDGVSALLVFVMSHGSRGQLHIGPAEVPLAIQNILDCIVDHDRWCSQPNVLIVQACQNDLSSPPLENPASFHLKKSHSALVSAALPGQVAWRNVFIVQLAELIQNNGYKDHLLQLCTKANRRVNATPRYLPQTPNHNSSLEKDLYLKWLQRIDA